jgi:hypothetical protein
MSPVFARRVPASDTRITRSLNSGTLALIALCTCTPIRAGDVVSTAASPLAQPKSLRQVGLPAAAIQAAIPADNPQTPEKIALDQRLFFDARRRSSSRQRALSRTTRPQRDTVRAFGPKAPRSKPPNTAPGCDVPWRSQTVGSITEC